MESRQIEESKARMAETYHDLKRALANMIPDHIGISESSGIFWRVKSLRSNVTETEMLHVCWLVEQTLDHAQRGKYLGLLSDGIHSNPTLIYFPAVSAAWQQRAAALCEVKGIAP